MKRAAIIPLLIPALATGCLQMEAEGVLHGVGRPGRERLTSVSVSFSASSPTKSSVDISAEEFTDAYLFAFREDAPAIAVYTDSREFTWDLPSEESLDIMAVVNPDSASRNLLEGWARGEDGCTKEALSALTFSCSSASELKALGTTGVNMPMAGSAPALLDAEGSNSLSIPVKRLFAKFSISIDVSSWAREGWTVTAAMVSAARSNTVVPYFYSGDGPGFGQNDPSKLATVDMATELDLEQLNLRDAANRSGEVALYFLENCQKVTESASRWNLVHRELGEQVENCSYMRVMVSATKEGYGKRCFGYRIYPDSAPDSELRTSFNIVRNTSRSIMLKLGTPQDGFLWINTTPANAAPGETVSLPFETSLEGSELTFIPDAEGLEYVSHSMGTGPGDIYPNCGTAILRVKDSATDNNYTVKGGNGAMDISDETTVSVMTPINLFYSFPDDCYAFKRFTVRIYSESTAGWPEKRRKNLESTFAKLRLRGTSGDEYVKTTGTVYKTNKNGTGDVLNKEFTVLSTRSLTAGFEAYDSMSGEIRAGIDVPCLSPIIHFIESNSLPFYDNNFSRFDATGDKGPVYDTPFTGEKSYGFFQFHDNYGNLIVVQAADLALGQLDLSAKEGFTFGRAQAPNVANAWKFWGRLDTWEHLEGLKSNENYVNASDACTFWQESYTSTLRLHSTTGQIVCSAPVHFEVTNPFLEWFPDRDSRPWSYAVTVDGDGDHVYTEEFYRDWPHSASLQPAVLSSGNVLTSKNGVSPYTLVWEDAPSEVSMIRIANDLHNYGCIKLGGSVTHSITGEVFTMLWGKVNVWREFLIYAGYQYSQVNYLSSLSTPYNSGKLSRFIPYLYAPNLSLSGMQLEKIVKTTAVSKTGINALNPSENFYKETCRTEHWWHGGSNYVNGATDHSGSTLWDCEYALSSRNCLLQNKIVVYSAPKKVTTKGEFSYYELQYAGPRVESHLAPVFGHNGYHADFVYSFRNIAYWNEPLFEFKTEGIESSYSPAIRTVTATGEKYLQLGDYTKIRFFWRKKKKSPGTKINSYDTRYATNVNQVFKTTYSNTGDASYGMYYFGSSIFQTTNTATAYYDPRRNVREKLKLFTPSIPFYRLKGSTVHAAFDGAVSGSYSEENVLDSHIIGEAYGTADSFWLPGNNIE